eukprot:gene28021-31122_t
MSLVYVVNLVSYELALQMSLKQVHPVFHVSLMKHAQWLDQLEFSGGASACRQKPAVADFNQNELFNVEHILD